jgi:hypothetical protein
MGVHTSSGDDKSQLFTILRALPIREHGIILKPDCSRSALYGLQFSYTRPIFSTRSLSISILFLMSSVYFSRNSLSSSFSPAGTTSLEPRDVFSRFPSYKHEMGTKLPSALHSHPWAALSAAPSEAESGVKIQQQFNISLRVCVIGGQHSLCKEGSLSVPGL